VVIATAVFVSWMNFGEPDELSVLLDADGEGTHVG
jgi:hypothetical protein